MNNIENENKFPKNNEISNLEKGCQDLQEEVEAKTFTIEKCENKIKKLTEYQETFKTKSKGEIETLSEQSRGKQIEVDNFTEKVASLNYKDLMFH